MKEEDSSNPCVRWIWIRHAPVQAREGVFTGSSDIPAHLEDAQTEIKILAKNLKSLLPQHPDLWISSELKRARQTAQALRETLQAERGESKQPLAEQIIKEQTFNEQDFGDWEGERYDEGRHRALWDAPASHRPPNGESFADLARRVARAVERIECTHARTSKGEEKSFTIVVVAHAGTIRAALAQALRLPLARALSFSIDPLSLTRIDRYLHSRQDRKKTYTLEDTLEVTLAHTPAAVRCVNLRARQEGTGTS